MSRKGRACPEIKITKSGLGKEMTQPLTKKQILDRLDWYGSELPYWHGKNPVWNKWAIARMSELNEMLREMKAHQLNVARKNS